MTQRKFPTVFIKWLPLFVFMVIIAPIYGWYAQIGEQVYGSNLFALLGKEFLLGHTYLALEPNPALATLQNPYDPAQNGPYRVQDLSYFNGKYYSYFGPVPALAVWIPIKWLTGISIRDHTIAWIMASIGTSCLLWLICLIARRQRFHSATGLLCTLLSISFGSWIPFLLREPFMYEAAIASAFGFTAMGILALWHFLDVRPLCRSLTFASLCLGLAAGCRITYALNGIILLVICIAIFRRSQMPIQKMWIITCLFFPWCFCLAALGLYNYERFGSPFDIGWRYVLSILGDLHDPGFNLINASFAPVNAYYYLLKTLPWKMPIGFPFFEPGAYRGSLLTVPWNAAIPWYQESVYGLLTNNPFSIFYVALLFNFKIIRQWQPQTRDLARSILLYSASIFLFILVYFFSSARYLVDFAPWIMALSGLYYMQLLQQCDNPATHRLLLAIGIVTALYGVFTGTMAGYCSYTHCLPAA